MTDRINIDNIKYDIEIIKYSNLKHDYNTRRRMINLFKKCETLLSEEVPSFFSQKLFFGDPNPPSNTTIFLLYRITEKMKYLIGFLVMENLIYKGKITQMGIEKYIKTDKKGAYLWWICGNNKYKGISQPLFTKFNKYLLINHYDYVLLVVEKNNNIIGLLNLYKTQGYLKIGTASFHKNNDMIVMKKIINIQFLIKNGIFKV